MSRLVYRVDYIVLASPTSELELLLEKPDDDSTV